MTIETTRWDAADYLNSDEAIAAFLNDVMEDGEPAHVLAALNTIARARGMAEIAQGAGIGRQALYKSLGDDGNPRLTTLMGILKSLGLRLAVRV